MQFALSYVRQVITVNDSADGAPIKVNGKQQIHVKKIRGTSLILVPLLVYLNNIAIKINYIT